MTDPQPKMTTAREHDGKRVVKIILIYGGGILLVLGTAFAWALMRQFG